MHSNKSTLFKPSNRFDSRSLLRPKWSSFCLCSPSFWWFSVSHLLLSSGISSFKPFLSSSDLWVHQALPQCWHRHHQQGGRRERQDPNGRVLIYGEEPKFESNNEDHLFRCEWDQRRGQLEGRLEGLEGNRRKKNESGCRQVQEIRGYLDERFEGWKVSTRIGRWKTLEGSVF